MLYGKTFLSPSVSSTLDSLNIDGSNIVQSDHPSGSKRGGVCCYFKECLPISILKITRMTECLVLKMLYNSKLVIVTVIYRSPSQSNLVISSRVHSSLNNNCHHQITFAHINLLINTHHLTIV